MKGQQNAMESAARGRGEDGEGEAGQSTNWIIATS